RPQPVPPVERKATLTRSEDGDPPVSFMRELLKGRQQALDRVRVTNGIPRNDRDAGNDLVGEEGPTVRAEEVRLVRAENEGRKRVRPMLVDERSDQLVLVLAGVTTIAPRGKPTGQQPKPAGDTEQEHRPGEPLAERSVEMGRPARIESRESGRRFSDSEPERVRPVGLDPVDPQGRRSVGEDRKRVDDGPDADLYPRRRVAAALEVVSPRDQGKRKRNAYRRLLVVEPFEDVQEGGNEHERDRQLPGAAA